MNRPPVPTLLLFSYDWDPIGFAAAAGAAGARIAAEDGFDLFSFPSNARLARFDIDRFTDRLADRARREGWQSVVSCNEQFGALAAAMLAEKMGWPGTPVKAVLACQHKLHARQVLQKVCPEANVGFSMLDAEYGGPVPAGLAYPAFVKPVKAAFSVLARTVHSHAQLHAHTRFGPWELWVIQRLVDPFERVFQARMGPSASAHRMMLEEPVQGQQFNLDGFVFNGEAQAFGVVDAVMYPGTQAFMRFDYPSRLPVAVQAQALEVAQKFLSAIGFTHGLFNMEFFHDAASGRLAVIEFNPRMASQFSDLYRRVDGVDLHAAALWMAQGRSPASLPRLAPTAGAASSLVYRSFHPDATVRMPDTAQVRAFRTRFADALLLPFPKNRAAIARDFKWLGSYRHGIVHLGGRDADDLRRRASEASALLGWTSPFPDTETVASPSIHPPHPHPTHRDWQPILPERKPA